MSTSLEEIRAIIIKNVAAELEVEKSQIDSDINFHELGLDSISSMFMLNELEDTYDISLKASHLLDYPTINEFSELVASLLDES